jgi:hypothetical protein
VIYPKLKRAERYPLTGNAGGQWREALALLEAGFPQSQVEMNARFRILSETRTSNIVELVLQPRSAGARRMMPQIEVEFSTNDFGLRSTELRFADGSAMRNEFRDSKLNPPIQDELFEPALDPDYKVVAPLKK